MVTEFDGRKMPELYTGEISPEYLEKKRLAIETAKKLQEEFDREYAENHKRDRKNGLPCTEKSAYR